MASQHNSYTGPRLSLKGLLSLPSRLRNPPSVPSPTQNRPWSVAPIYQVRLEDVLDRKHLPPLGLKDFEQYLLAVEHQPEPLYFVLWLKEYSARYHTWSTTLAKRHQVRPGGGRRPASTAYRVGNPAASETSPELAAFYTRAQQTFFCPGAPYALDAPADVLAPLLPSAASAPSAVFLDADLDGAPSRRGYGAHPDPEVFTELALIAHVRLRAALDRFVRASYPNVGSQRALCGLAGGTVIALVGTIAPLAVNFAEARSRWERFAALPGLWIGLSIVVASLNGLCVLIYLFGDLRQLRTYELPLPPSPPPPSEPLPPQPHPLSEKRPSYYAHSNALDPSPPWSTPAWPAPAHRPSATRAQLSTDILEFRRSKRADLDLDLDDVHSTIASRRSSRLPPLIVAPPPRAHVSTGTLTLPPTPLSATPSTTPLMQTRRLGSPTLISASPPVSPTFPRPVVTRPLSPMSFNPDPEFVVDPSLTQAAAANAHPRGSHTVDEDGESDDGTDDDDASEYVDEHGEPLPPPVIEVSGAFYDGPADEPGAPEPVECLPPAALHAGTPVPWAGGSGTQPLPVATASFIKPEHRRKISVDSTPRGSEEISGLGHDGLLASGPTIIGMDRREETCTFSFEGLPMRGTPLGHRPSVAAGAGALPGTWDPEKGAWTGRPGSPGIVFTSPFAPAAEQPWQPWCAANEGIALTGKKGVFARLLAGAQESCTAQARRQWSREVVSERERERRTRESRGVRPFATPLTDIQSDLITRAQWEIFVRSAAVAFLIAAAIVGVFVAVPVPS